MKYIIVLSGPPSSGKDTAAKWLETNFSNVHHLEMKSPLFRIAKATAPVDEVEWDERYSCPKLKNEPWHKLNGLSQRQFMIRISEEWCKPTFGTNYFGNYAADTVEQIKGFGDRYCIFSDGGFQDELDVLSRVSGSKLYVIRLHREGCDFSNDSRSYLHRPGWDTDVENNGDIAEFHKKIQEAIETITETRLHFQIRNRISVPVHQPNTARIH